MYVSVTRGFRDNPHNLLFESPGKSNSSYKLGNKMSEVRLLSQKLSVFRRLTPQNKWIAIAWDGCFTLVLRPHLHSGCFHFRSAHQRSVREEGFLGSDVCWSRHRISERERTTSPAILWRISVESEGRAPLLDKCLASVCCVVCVIHCYLSRDTSFHICVSVWSSKGVMWWCWRTILVLLLLLSSSGCDGRRKTLEPRNPIEDVDSKRLEELIDTEEYLVVFFCEYWNFIFL